MPADKSMKEYTAGKMILGEVLVALGIYFIVWGFITQSLGGMRLNIWALVEYFIGLFLMGLDKVIKWKAMGMMK